MNANLIAGIAMYPSLQAMMDRLGDPAYLASTAQLSAGPASQLNSELIEPIGVRRMRQEGSS